MPSPHTANGHTPIDTGAIRRQVDLLRLLPPMARVASTHGGEYAGPCPFCGGTDRFRVWPQQDGGGRAWCRQCDWKGDAIALVMQQQGVDFPEACRRLAPTLAGSPPPARKAPKARAHPTPTLVDTTLFEDADGVPRLKKERYEPGWPDPKTGAARDKSFVLYHADPDAPGGWRKGRPADPQATRAMFNLRAILAAPEGSTVYFCEGETKAKRLTAAGLLATCKWEGGTAWQPAYRAAFLDQHAVILEDNDETGRKLTERALPSIQRVARTVRVIRFPELGVGEDVLDWLDRGHTVAELEARVAATVPEPDPGEAAPPTPPTEPPRFRFLSLTDLASLPPPAWLLDSIVTQAGLSVLYGPSGVGKSFVALDWALSVATGQPWLGQAAAPGPIIYMAAEGTAGIAQRVAAWELAHGDAQTAPVWVLPEAVNLMDPATAPALLAALPAAQPALIVVDTLARSMIGGDENATKDMGLLINAVDQLRKCTGAAILLIHHTGKNGELERGSSALRAAADTMIKCTADGDIVTLECDKQKDAAPFDPRRLVRYDIGASCALRLATMSDLTTTGPLTGTLRTILEALADTLGGSATIGEIKGATGVVPERTLYRALRTLEQRGLLDRVGTARTPQRRYQTTPAGYAALGLAPQGSLPDALAALTLPGSATADHACLPPEPDSATGLPPGGPPPTDTPPAPHYAQSATSATVCHPSATAEPDSAGGLSDTAIILEDGSVSQSGRPVEGAVTVPDWRARTTTPPPTAPPPPHLTCKRCGEWDQVWLRTGGWTCSCYLSDPLPAWARRE